MIEIYNHIPVDKFVVKKEGLIALTHVNKDATRVNASLAIIKVR
jgi:hypothetical protein